ncbi:replication-relaxation family protein [Nocardiopsis sp. NPDC058631]|uniref:replication-relaxation family protein n=1 Tax=Nocardiopsis sp. NPDC058631 TaxID=3346566 RepID=UPI0036511519
MMMATVEPTARDLRILESLHLHRVLTTPQVGELFFSGTASRAARRRLLEFVENDLAARFTPRHAGWNAPCHWTLGPEGARVLASRRGLAPHQIGYRADTHLRLWASRELGHATGLSQTYVRFATTARATRGATLQRWWSEDRCRATWGHRVHPDGYLRWYQDGTTLDAFVEYDTGTQALTRLAEKVSHYRDLAEETRLRTPVLFVVPGPSRLTALCRRLDGGPRVPVHVTTHGQLAYPGPIRPVWRRAGDLTGAVRPLIDLA